MSNNVRLDLIYLEVFHLLTLGKQTIAWCNLLSSRRVFHVFIQYFLSIQPKLRLQCHSHFRNDFTMCKLQ